MIGQPIQIGTDVEYATQQRARETRCGPKMCASMRRRVGGEIRRHQYINKANTLADVIPAICCQCARVFP